MDAAGLNVRVATTAVLVLLKMIAFLDRPSDRERDLEDIAHTVHQYGADDDRRWVLEPLGGRDWDEQSAWLLGLDVQQIAQTRHRDLALEFLQQLIEPPHGWAGRMAQLGPTGWNRDSAEAARRMSAVREGLTA